MDALRKVLGAAMLGVGAIFGHKYEPDQHWSEVPTLVVPVTTVDRATGAGGPTPGRPEAG